MDHRELKKLVQLMNDNEIVELEIEQEGLRVSLRKAGADASVSHAVGPVFAPPPPAPPPVPAEAPATDAEPAEVPGTVLIRSPMVGTFYRRPSPESDPYIGVGDPVDDETVVCIIEAMKVNNELKAEKRGQLLAILVEDGQPVEYDQPLFRLKVE